MRILYVSYNHPQITPGGAQLVAYELFKASLDQGHDAYLICALEPEQEQDYGKPGAPIVPLPGEERQYLYFPQNYDFLHLSVGDWRSIRFFQDFVAWIDPEVVHFHHYHRIGVESIRAARLGAPRATLCLTFHEMMAICMAGGQMVTTKTRELCHAATPLACHRCFPELRPEFVTLRQARLKAMLEECDVYVFPSEFLAERYVQWGLPEAKCVVIQNGQRNPAPHVDRGQHAPHVNRFGFFGQMIDNKGIDVILDALILLARENRFPACGIVLEINGGNRHYATPDYLAKLAEQMAEIEHLGVGPVKVTERGPYGREQLASRMHAVDWVIAPSTWWEVFGLVVSEAWMFGRPVIASKIGGLGERVQNDVNGFTFPARDSRALAELLVRLTGNERAWTHVNRGITQPWSDREMLQAHIEVWGEMKAFPGSHPSDPPVQM